MKVKCSYCKASFEIDEKNVDTNLEYIQCPLCSQITKNPFHEA